MQRLEVSGAVRPLEWSLCVKELRSTDSSVFDAVTDPLGNQACGHINSSYITARKVFKSHALDWYILGSQRISHFKFYILTRYEYNPPDTDFVYQSV